MRIRQRRDVNRACEGLAVGLANVVHLFNPDLIILGGGVSEGLTQLEPVCPAHPAGASTTA